MLSVNWFLTHTPAPGSDVPYTPKPVDYDPSRQGGLSRAPDGLPGSLRAIERAHHAEMARIEWGAR